MQLDVSFCVTVVESTISAVSRFVTAGSGGVVLLARLAPFKTYADVMSEPTKAHSTCQMLARSVKSVGPRDRGYVLKAITAVGSCVVERLLSNAATALVDALFEIVREVQLVDAIVDAFARNDAFSKFLSRADLAPTLTALLASLARTRSGLALLCARRELALARIRVAQSFSKKGPTGVRGVSEREKEVGEYLRTAALLLDDPDVHARDLLV